MQFGIAQLQEEVIWLPSLNRSGRRKLLEQLSGVGDISKGEWHEFTGRAYHIRRRLTTEEEAVIGPAVDLRGTDEATQRFEAMKPFLSARHEALALSELTGFCRT